jgi:hypothetical protein
MWGGALVLTAYSLGFSPIGARLLMRKDIS